MKPRNKLNYLNNEKGATSVLVIFMMIVLVTLGAFAITSANVNIIFARKASNLGSIYYLLDSKGEEFVYDVDKALAEAEILAIDYMTNMGYNENSYKGVPNGLQQIIKANFAVESLSNDFVNETINKIYLYNANENLKILREKYPDSEVFDFTQDDEVIEIASSLNIASTDYPNYNLDIGYIVLPLSYDMNILEGNVSGVKDISLSRYEITSWSQWQTPVENATEGVKLWDGNIKE